MWCLYCLSISISMSTSILTDGENPFYFSSMKRIELQSEEKPVSAILSFVEVNKCSSSKQARWKNDTYFEDVLCLTKRLLVHPSIPQMKHWGEGTRHSPLLQNCPCCRGHLLPRSVRFSGFVFLINHENTNTQARRCHLPYIYNYTSRIWIS